MPQPDTTSVESHSTPVMVPSTFNTQRAPLLDGSAERSAFLADQDPQDLGGLGRTCILRVMHGLRQVMAAVPFSERHGRLPVGLQSQGPFQDVEEFRPGVKVPTRNPA